jgi:hypothetical protein
MRVNSVLKTDDFKKLFRRQTHHLSENPLMLFATQACFRSQLIGGYHAVVLIDELNIVAYPFPYVFLFPVQPAQKKLFDVFHFVIERG